jgi:hypothetical protein
LAVLAAAPALAIDSGKCDAKPFTLKKPTAAEVAPKPPPPPKAPQAKLAPAPKPARTTAGIAPCKTPK